MVQDTAATRRDIRPDAPRVTRDVPMVGRQYFVRMTPDLASTLRTGEARIDTISLERLDELRRDDVIRAALIVCKAPIAAQFRRATIECEDEAIAAAATAALIDTGLIYAAARTALLAFDFGVAFHEKRWTVKPLSVTYPRTDPVTGDQADVSAFDGPALTYHDIISVNPVHVTRIKRRTEPRAGKPADGSFDGFIWDGKDPEGWVPPARAWVYGYQAEFGNLWGRARIRDAHPYWVWGNFLWKIWMHWLEKRAVPPRAVRHPPGTQPETGEDNGIIAVRLANAIDSASAVAMPNATDAAGKYAWDVQEWPNTDRTSVFLEAISRLDDAKLWSMFVPKRVFMEAEFGSRADAEAHGDIFLLTLDADAADIADSMTRYLVRDWVALNFGIDAPAARVVVPGLTDEQKAITKQVLTAAMTAPQFLDRLDLDALVEPFGIPLRDVQPQAAAGVDEFGNPLPPEPGGVPAPAPPASAAPAPDNLVLSDFDQVVLLGPLADLSRYELRPDASRKSGFRVIDKTTGKTLSGFVALRIIQAFQSRAANEAKRAQSRSETAGRKAARERAAAARKAASQAASARKKAAREAESARKKGERESAAAARKTAAEQKRAAATAAREQKAAARTTERTRTQAERTQAAARTQQVATARAERAELDRLNATKAEGEALRTIAAKGWQVLAAGVADHDAAVEQARTAAERDDTHIYTIMRVGKGYAVVKKPRASLQTRPGPGNVAASDADTAADGNGGTPDVGPAGADLDLDLFARPDADDDAGIGPDPDADDHPPAWYRDRGDGGDDWPDAAGAAGAAPPLTPAPAPAPDADLADRYADWLDGGDDPELDEFFAAITGQGDGDGTGASGRGISTG